MRRILLASLACLAALAPSVADAQPPRVVEIQYVPVQRAQIAMWVEDPDGNFLRTLGLTQATAYRGIGNRPGASQMNSGFRWPYGRREGVLPVWAHRRAAAEGAERFRRVIFQNRRSEGDASRSSADYSEDSYFCLSFRSGDEGIDAVSCASTFNSDKGRFVTEQDVTRGYFEPYELAPGETIERELDLWSLYPPRRDALRCTSAGCYDHPDVATFVDEARRVMPEIDAVTMATPPGETPQRMMVTWPAELPDGEYRLFVEVNTELDYNAEWGPDEYPTPLGPDNEPFGDEYWDWWAENNGFPYRGQPSVVYAVSFRVGGGADRQQTAEPEGYGSLSGIGDDAGEMHTMDGSISNDPESAPGSGADRLRLQEGTWRLRVTVTGPEVCEENVAPEEIGSLEITQYEERRDAHRYAQLAFEVPGDDLGIAEYQVRVATHAIASEEDFQRALPANAASLDSVALMVPTNRATGETVEVDFGGLAPETHYWVAMRAVDACNVAGPIVVAEYTTPPVQFTTVSPCFVATAAYGSPLAEEIGALRRFRDRHLRTNAIGRALVAAYEAVGPTLAGAIRDDEDARSVVRTLLSPIVALARWIDG
ncbi:CFI-box-CTERM domain-containing protein [Sandaracinus amylolyticus]|nr:CFI-box-CTERM domain-containing protein [Sandaracinus amylolyticus]